MEPYERLQLIAKESGLTDKIFAKMIGMKPQSFSALKNGKVKMNDNFLGKLFRVHRINPEWIMQGIGDKYLKESANDPRMDTIDKLNEAMETYGITQAEIAQKTGFSKQFVNQIVLRKNLPSRDFVEKFETAFNIHIGHPAIEKEKAREKLYLNKKHEDAADLFTVSEPSQKYQKEPVAITINETSVSIFVSIEKEKLTKPLIISIV